MPTLFRRLRAVGFDEDFVRRVVLPDWWDDSLADDPGTRWQMELRIAQRLSLSLEDLSDPDRPLRVAGTHGIRLKRARAGTARSEVSPGMIAARNAVALVLPHLVAVPPLPACLNAPAFRQWILGRRSPVDLAGLVDACWSHGIAVLHFAPVPRNTRKFAGMTYFEGPRPVVVLASGHDAPPRLAFYLAHEVGHILRGHVVPGGDMLVDTDLDQATEDLQEREADGDALEILTGDRSPGFRPRYGLTADKLVHAVRQHEAKHGIHAGTVALIYGKTAARMPAASSALKLMKMDTGGRAILAEALSRRLPSEASDLPGAALEVLPFLGIDRCP